MSPVEVRTPVIASAVDDQAGTSVSRRIVEAARLRRLARSPSSRRSGRRCRPARRRSRRRRRRRRGPASSAAASSPREPRRTSRPSAALQRDAVAEVPATLASRRQQEEIAVLPEVDRAADLFLEAGEERNRLARQRDVGRIGELVPHAAGVRPVDPVPSCVSRSIRTTSAGAVQRRGNRPTPAPMQPPPTMTTSAVVHRRGIVPSRPRYLVAPASTRCRGLA